MVGEVTRTHFFVRVIIWRILRINHDVSIVIGGVRIIAPNVCFSDLMIWIVTARRQLRIVSKDLANFENSGGRAAISLLFSKTRLVLPPKQTRAPGEAD